MSKYIDLQEAFEIELNVLDDGLNKPKSMDTEWWLNRGLEKFWKTRYAGINPKGTAFEQDQKRIDDLRTLVTTTVYKDDKIIKSLVDRYAVKLPEDYVILLGDTSGITPLKDNECWEKDEEGNYIIKYNDSIESSIETIDRQLRNSLSEHRLKYCQARPLRLIQGDEIKLYTDGQYKVSEYKIVYLRRPRYIDIHTDPFAEYSDMPEHTHSEIVKIAAQMYIENQSNQRLNTHNSEVQEME